VAVSSSTVASSVESSGHLSEKTWRMTAEELVEMTVTLVAAAPGDRDTVRTWPA
jgi:hypothetical protein